MLQYSSIHSILHSAYTVLLQLKKDSTNNRWDRSMERPNRADMIPKGLESIQHPVHFFRNLSSKWRFSESEYEICRNPFQKWYFDTN